MARETWYVLDDGSLADPREVSPDDAGVLRYKGGRVVAIGDHGNPRTSGVDIDDATGKPLFAAKGDHDGNGSTGGSAKTADMKPEPASAPKAKKPYKTR